MADPTYFLLKREHLALLAEAEIDFDEHAEYGAPLIDPKRPYGNSMGIEEDIARAVGILGPTEDRSLTREEHDTCYTLHRELASALQVVFQARQMTPGYYVFDKERRKWAWAPQKNLEEGVIQEAQEENETSEVAWVDPYPEGPSYGGWVYFEVTEDHLKLLPHFNITTREVWPCVDTKRPFGNKDVEQDMCKHLGIEPEGRHGFWELALSEEQRAYLDTLIQGFPSLIEIRLTLGDLTPGWYRRSEYGSLPWHRYEGEVPSQFDASC